MECVKNNTAWRKDIFVCSSSTRVLAINEAFIKSKLLQPV
jgi:hypothetical protein